MGYLESLHHGEPELTAPCGCNGEMQWSAQVGHSDDAWQLCTGMMHAQNNVTWGREGMQTAMAGKHGLAVLMRSTTKSEISKE
eukprot:1151275-Pelagomonas_calceolata.AAC.3